MRQQHNMKLFKYESASGPRWGFQDGPPAFALSQGEAGEASAKAVLEGEPPPASSEPIDLPSMFLPPLLATSTVYCVGLNYLDHVKQTQREVTDFPTLFIRNHASLVGHDHAMRVPRASPKLDYEGEIAVVIGKPGRNIDANDALNHVYGLTCLNDGSLRDHQKHSLTAGKNFDRSGACGPWIARRGARDELRATSICTRLNGQEMQRSDTSLLIHSIASLIAYLSTIVELRPGDVLATGTPGGTGNRRSPQLFMKPGDMVEIEIEGIGILRNLVIAEE